METTKKVLQGAALASVVFLCVVLGMLCLELRDSVRLVGAAADLTPWLISTEFEATRGILGEKVDGLYDIVRHTVSVSDARLASIQRDSVAQIALLRTDTLAVVDNHLSRANDSVAGLVDVYKKVPTDVEASLRPFTDCSTNTLCYQNQISDTLFAVRTASRDVSSMAYVINKAAPSIAADFKVSTDIFAKGWPQIVDNTTGITSNVNRLTKPAWYDRILSGTVTGAIVYGNVKRK